MMKGAAYDICQTMGWTNGHHHSNHRRHGTELRRDQSMRGLVVARIVQGFSTPPLMMLIMFVTNNRAIMGDRVNGRAVNILGRITTAVIFSASAGLVISSFLH
jgi:Mn2+/Fe2+ NRAMP family transporter